MAYNKPTKRNIQETEINKRRVILIQRMQQKDKADTSAKTSDKLSSEQKKKMGRNFSFILFVQKFFCSYKVSLSSKFLPVPNTYYSIVISVEI
jgi:hypothetical protein